MVRVTTSSGPGVEGDDSREKGLPSGALATLWAFAVDASSPQQVAISTLMLKRKKVCLGLK